MRRVAAGIVWQRGEGVVGKRHIRTKKRFHVRCRSNENQHLAQPRDERPARVITGADARLVAMLGFLGWAAVAVTGNSLAGSQTAENVLPAAQFGRLNAGLGRWSDPR